MCSWWNVHLSYGTVLVAQYEASTHTLVLSRHPPTLKATLPVPPPTSQPPPKRPDARLSGGLRARPTACAWAKLRLGFGAPLAQAVDKSFGPDVEIDDARAHA